MLFTLGINHRTAPVQVRERLAVNEVQLGEALDSLHSGVRVPEAAILSTCNRTEIYFREKDRTGEDRVLDWLGGFHGIRARRARDPTCTGTTTARRCCTPCAWPAASTPWFWASRRSSAR
jgi:glutamyl-tRNA reductase